MGRPASAASKILRRAAAAVAMSSTNGGCTPAGTATASGLVPRNGRRLPNGATLGAELAMVTPIIPSAAAIKG